MSEEVLTQEEDGILIVNCARGGIINEAAGGEFFEPLADEGVFNRDHFA